MDEIKIHKNLKTFVFSMTISTNPDGRMSEFEDHKRGDFALVDNIPTMNENILKYLIRVT